MGRDFITTVFYGYFLSKEDSEILSKKFESDEGEEPGFYAFSEKLDQDDSEIEAFSVENGIGDDVEYRYAIAIRKSVKRMYLNEMNEYHRVSDLTKEPFDEDWDFILNDVPFKHGLSQPEDIDWWISMEGQ